MVAFLIGFLGAFFGSANDSLPVAVGSSPAMDSMRTATELPSEAARTVDTVARAESSTAPVPLSSATASPDSGTPEVSRVVREPQVEMPSERKVLLILDLADADFKGLQYEHFHKWPKHADWCCVDVSWYPFRSSSNRWAWGGAINGGAWRQYLDADASHIFVLDLALQGSVLREPAPNRAGIWARADLGASFLTVSRHTTGEAPGVAGQMRAGWEFDALGRRWLVSVGTSSRWWPALDAVANPSAIFSAGGWL